MKPTRLEAGQDLERLLFPQAGRVWPAQPAPRQQAADPTGQLSKLDPQRVVAFSYSITPDRWAGQGF